MRGGKTGLRPKMQKVWFVEFTYCVCERYPGIANQFFSLGEWSLEGNETNIFITSHCLHTFTEVKLLMQDFYLQ